MGKVIESSKKDSSRCRRWNILELVLSVSWIQWVCKTLFVYLVCLRDVFGSLGVCFISRVTHLTFTSQ